jgi:branched-chain amino acid transport system ATP-binding protein
LHRKALVRAGLAHVPEGRQLFTEMSVDDNLRLGAYSRRDATYRARDGHVRALSRRSPKRETRERLLALGRRAADARDRPRPDGAAETVAPRRTQSTGLAPADRRDDLRHHRRTPRSGTAILLVEQNAYLTLKHADRAYVLENGASPSKAPPPHSPATRASKRSTWAH